MLTLPGVIDESGFIFFIKKLLKPPNPKIENVPAFFVGNTTLNVASWYFGIPPTSIKPMSPN